MKYLATVLSLAVLLSPQVAMAQSQTVRQSGPVTGGHASCWTYNGIIQDCGTATGTDASLTTLGIVQDGGLPFCVVDTKIHTGPYRQFCFSVSSSGIGTISLNPFNGAGPLTMDIVINGVTYTFPQVIPPPPIAATPLRNIAAGATDTITSNDANGSVAWNSATTSAKTETLPACSVPVNGFTVAVKDEAGTASTYPITISGAQNIEQWAYYVMNFNQQSVTLQCNGIAAKWVLK